MADSIQVTTLVAATPDRLFRCWLNGKEHARLTGRDVRMQPREGSEFTLDDGAVVGTTRLLEPNRRIVQSLRSERFGDDAPDSLLEVLLEPVGRDKTRMSIIHSDVPRGLGAEFKRDWQRELDALSESIGPSMGLAGQLKRGLRAAKRRVDEMRAEIWREQERPATKPSGTRRAAQEPAKVRRPKPRRTEPPLEERRAAATRAKRKREATAPDPQSKRSRERFAATNERQRPPEARPRPGKSATGKSATGKAAAGEMVADAPARSGPATRQTGRRMASKAKEKSARTARARKPRA